jgi:prophage regulatory protein
MLATSKQYKQGLCKLVSEHIPVERVIRPQEMRKLLMISRTTLYRWSKSGKFIKPITYNGKTIGWKESEYHRWLNPVSH